VGSFEFDPLHDLASRESYRIVWVRMKTCAEVLDKPLLFCV
jgi:hypothetical protein